MNRLNKVVAHFLLGTVAGQLWAAEPREDDKNVVQGTVTDQEGHPLADVAVRLWGPRGLSKDIAKTDVAGNYRMDINGMEFDAVLFDHPDFHIQVQGNVASRRGKPISPMLFDVAQERWPADISPALRFCHIANEYEEAALLTLLGDSFNRRFIVYEFEERGVMKRLEQLQVPATFSDKQSESNADRFLREKRDRLIETFHELQGRGEYQKR